EFGATLTSARAPNVSRRRSRLCVSPWYGVHVRSLVVWTTAAPVGVRSTPWSVSILGRTICLRVSIALYLFPCALGRVALGLDLGLGFGLRRVAGAFDQYGFAVTHFVTAVRTCGHGCLLLGSVGGVDGPELTPPDVGAAQVGLA